MQPHITRSTFFDAIFVVQLLPPSEEPTGQILFDSVIDPLSRSNGIHSELHVVDTRNAFLATLAKITIDVHENGRKPLLHFETHGGDDGIGFGTEMVLWSELSPHLQTLNRLSEVNLLVTVAACNGLALAKTLIVSDRAPVWGLLGPNKDVLPTIIRLGFTAFYTELLASLNFNLAHKALREADPHQPDCWKFQNAELFLAFHYGALMAKQAEPGGIEAAEELLLKQVKARRPSAPTDAPWVRALVRRVSADSDGAYDHVKQNFLMLDLFPHNAGRFPLRGSEALDLYRRATGDE